MTGTEEERRSVHNGASLRNRQVDRIATLITDAVQRIDARHTACGLAGRGEYGPAVQRAVQS